MEPDGASPSAPVVLYDANVLYPFHLRNLLVQLGVNDIAEPRWTDTIHDEWIRNVAAAGIAGRDRLLRTRDIMKRVLPGADVIGYESRIEGLSLPDPDDRHVLAAAITGQAAGSMPKRAEGAAPAPGRVPTPLFDSDRRRAATACGSGGAPIFSSQE